MPRFRAPRGTRDLLPDEAARFLRLAEIARGLTERYGYRPIETPLFEQAVVFERGIGAVTDVVEKELFRIAPRTEESESWALRPEPTARIVRAHLDGVGVPYRLAPGLVRGLDYYTRTTFEFHVTGREGQQQALAGGGRY